jgi:hypothetical protein
MTWPKDKEPIRWKPLLTGGLIGLVLATPLCYVAYQHLMVLKMAGQHFAQVDKRIVSTNIHPGGVVCVTYFDPVQKPTVVTECPVPLLAPQKVDK